MFFLYSNSQDNQSQRAQKANQDRECKAHVGIAAPLLQAAVHRRHAALHRQVAAQEHHQQHTKRQTTTDSAATTTTITVVESTHTAGHVVLVLVVGVLVRERQDQRSQTTVCLLQLEPPEWS